MSKKVLFVATVVKQHINVFHLPYIKWFSDQGYEVHVAARNDYEFKEECIIPNCTKFYDMSFSRSPLSSDNIKALKSLKTIITENSYDIIHCHTPVGGMLSRVAVSKRDAKKTKVAYTAHGYHFIKGGPIMDWIKYFPLEFMMRKRTDMLICINDQDYKLAKKFKLGRKICKVDGVGVNYNIVDAKKDYNFKDNISLIFVGELSLNKNQTFLIEVINNLKKRYPTIVLNLVGAFGIQYDNLVDQVKKLNLDQHIIFHGYRNDVGEMMMNSDIVVSSSKREGLPMNVMEAMSFGLPLVVSDCRGNSDLIVDNENGYVSKLDVQEFSDKISKMIENYPARVKMGNLNKELSKKYHINEVLKQYEKIYIELM